ncbi:hypothetical protein J3E64_002175 [Sphingobium sp. OAS761]|nr:hypothetical protein [Sphingobium sp. OAS761]MCP1470487.1 hypothetical protein [Sphingobium sp. OAS761]
MMVSCDALAGLKRHKPEALRALIAPYRAASRADKFDIGVGVDRTA